MKKLILTLSFLFLLWTISLMAGKDLLAQTTSKELRQYHKLQKEKSFGVWERNQPKLKIKAAKEANRTKRHLARRSKVLAAQNRKLERILKKSE